MDSKCDNIASSSGLHDDHITLTEKEQAVAADFASGDLDKAKETYATFQEANLAHLKKEEVVMMPRLQEMAKMGLPLKGLMVKELLATIVDSPDFKFFVQYANDVLERHSENMPRARVFDHALWAVATPEQWKEWDAWIKETVSAEIYREIHDAIGDM